MDLGGRVAVVTGGAVRVGRAIALALAAAGADVFVHFNSSPDAAAETAADIEALGVRAGIGSADLSDPRAAAALIAAAGALGPPTVLVNSASGFPEDTLADVTPERLERTLRLTLMGPVFATQAFAAGLAAGAEAAVVNVTDVRTQTPYRKHFSYILAKGSVDTLTRAAAVALAPRIRVNAVALGVILPPSGEDDAYLAALAAALPLARPGGTPPVAAAVLHLLQNDFITGEIVRVDGGGHLV
jgi:glucose 1-dehydrogenase